MNHLEQLVGEWLQYNGYFVRNSVLVGARERGGFEGELDVVGYHLGIGHLLHIECSLDAKSLEKRQAHFARKFDCGQRHIREALGGGFSNAELPPLDQVVVLQFSSGRTRTIGGARLVTVREFVHEVFHGLQGTSPQSKAVPSNLPLLRTLQLAADASKVTLTEHRILGEKPST